MNECNSDHILELTEHEMQTAIDCLKTGKAEYLKGNDAEYIFIDIIKQESMPQTLGKGHDKSHVQTTELYNRLYSKLDKFSLLIREFRRSYQITDQLMTNRLLDQKAGSGRSTCGKSL